MYLGFLYTNWNEREKSELEKKSIEKTSEIKNKNYINELIRHKKEKIICITPFKIKDFIYDTEDYKIIILGYNEEKSFISLELLEDM